VRARTVLGVAAVVACDATGTSRAPNAPATAASAPATGERDAASAPTQIADPKPAPTSAEAPRTFLLELLDASRRRDAEAWSRLQSQSLLERDLESAPLAELRMAAWANDLAEIEADIRQGRVFTEPSGGRTVVKVEAPGVPARAVVFVTVEDGQLKLDEN